MIEKIGYPKLCRNMTLLENYYAGVRKTSNTQTFPARSRLKKSFVFLSKHLLFLVDFWEAYIRLSTEMLNFFLSNLFCFLIKLAA